MAKKRIISLLLALVLTASVFSGCSNSNQPSSSGSAPASGSEASQAESTPASSASGESAHLVYMGWATKDELPIELERIKDFEAKTPGITVEYLQVPGDQYVTKMNTMASSNTLPDIAMINEAQCLKWADAGLLADISDLFGAEDEMLEDIAYRDADGNVVAYATANEILILFYNKQYFDEAGMEYPPANAEDAWTWDEFVDVAKKLTKDANGVTADQPNFDPNNIQTFGTNIKRSNAWVWDAFARSNGGGLCSLDGNEFWLDKPETIEAIQALADLTTVHHVQPSLAQLQTMPSPDAMLLTNRVAMAIDGQWIIGSLGVAKQENNLDYGVGVLPKFKDPVTVNTGGALAIFSTTSNMEAARTFYKYATDSMLNLPNIQAGVHMPTQKKWYTDSELIDTWCNTPAHPDKEMYQTAVIDYALDCTAQTAWFYLPTYARLTEVIVPALDPVWVGEQTAQDAISKIMPTVQPIFDSKSPN